MGHEVAIAEALQIAQEGGHASVNDHLIQHNLLVQMGVVVCRARRNIGMCYQETCSNTASNKFSTCCICRRNTIAAMARKEQTKRRETMWTYALRAVHGGCAACLSWHVGTLVCSKTSLCSAYFHCIEANFLLCEAHKQTSELTRQREMMADRKTSSQGLQVSSIYNTMI